MVLPLRSSKADKAADKTSRKKNVSLGENFQQEKFRHRLSKNVQIVNKSLTIKIQMLCLHSWCQMWLMSDCCFYFWSTIVMKWCCVIYLVDLAQKSEWLFQADSHFRYWIMMVICQYWYNCTWGCSLFLHFPCDQKQYGNFPTSVIK